MPKRKGKGLSCAQVHLWSLCLAPHAWAEYDGARGVWWKTTVHIMMDRKPRAQQEGAREIVATNLLCPVIYFL